MPITSKDIDIIQEKILSQQTSYESKATKLYDTKQDLAPSFLSFLNPDSASAAYQQERYSGITVTTWATDYSAGTSYDVRYKLFGVFNWLWDDESGDFTYNPHLSGDDFMTLNWAGDLTLENQRTAEVQVTEYQWDTSNVTYTYSAGNSSGFIKLADVETNGGIGFRFKERYQLGAPAYQAKADHGNMSVFVHKNNSSNEDGNFKFTYTHTWKTTEIGYSVEAGVGTAGGGISITSSDKTANFITYDNAPI